MLTIIWLWRTNGNCDTIPRYNRLLDRIVKSSGYGLAGSPGLSVEVIRDGKIIAARSYGLADLSSGARISSATNFRIASVSKQFTAMAILILLEQGKLSLDNTLTDFFPGFPAYGHAITIRQLLNHTSGIRSYEQFIDEYRHTQISDQDVLHVLEQQKDGYFLPGADYRYSNSGYVLLALIAEHVSGQSFADFMRQHIFLPLHMDQSFVVGSVPQKIPKRAYGYSKVGDHWIKTDQSVTSATYGDGGVYSSVADLYKWDQALYSNRLVSKPTMALAFTPGTYGNEKKSHYGFGWGIDTVNGYRKLSHEGASIGFRSYILRLPEQRFSVIVLMNYGDGDPVRVANAITRTFFPAIAPAMPGPVKLSQAALSAFSGFYQVRGKLNEIKAVHGGLNWTGIIDQPIRLSAQNSTTFFYTDADLNPEGSYRVRFQNGGFSFEVDGREAFKGTYICGDLTRVDPLIKPPISSARIRYILQLLAKGGTAPERAHIITEQLRSDAETSPRHEFDDVINIYYLQAKEVRPKLLSRLDQDISQILFVNATTKKSTFLVALFLTENKFVADAQLISSNQDDSTRHSK